MTFKGEIIDSGVCHQAIFEDPDGNTLDLHHRYAPRTCLDLGYLELSATGVRVGA